MNYSDLLTATTNTLAENAVSPLVWSQAEIGRGINEGMLMFSLLSMAFQGTATLTPTANAILQAVPSPVVWPLQLSVGGSVIYLTTPQVLDATVPGWLDTAASTPYCWFRVGLFSVGLYPRPAATGPVSVTGIIQPTSLVNATDTPALSPEDEQALVSYGTYYGLLKGNDADFDRALTFYDDFTARASRMLVKVILTQPALAQEMTT